MNRANINLNLGDCLDGMRDYPDGHWDLAVVDPPYGLDIANMRMGAGNSKRCSKIENRKWTSRDWDKNVPSQEYFKELFRVSKNQIIWGGNYFGLPRFEHYIVWDKEIYEGLSFSQCEMAWTSFKGANKIFRYSVYRDKKGRFHPTAKPAKLYEWIFQNYAKEGDRILDTHGGSMSIAIAAWDMGFDLDLWEIDPDYYDEGKKRFQLHKRQLQLF